MARYRRFTGRLRPLQPAACLLLVDMRAITAAETTAYRDAMSKLACGIVLLTCSVGGRPWGMTVTAFQSVSVEPPVVLVSLESRTRAAQAVCAEGRFGISVLAEHHEELARWCARPGAAKHLESYEIEDALANLDCEVLDALRVADHTVFLARVRRVQGSGADRALVYHRRSYRSI